MKASEAREAALAAIAIKTKDKESGLLVKFPGVMDAIRKTCEKGEWGVFIDVVNTDANDFIWLFEHLGYNLRCMPVHDRRTENPKYIMTFHITW